jgi:predicted nucleic acid-binding protein
VAQVSRWIVDASVLLANEDPRDDYGADARILLEGPDAVLTIDLAFYEATNVAITSWNDPDAARRLWERITALAFDGGLIRVDAALIHAAIGIATAHGISVYDAAYVAAAEAAAGRLVSCDVRDLVSRSLAITPSEALADVSDDDEESGERLS